MRYRYGSILLRSTLLATLPCLASYEQCSTRLLKILHKHCNMDMLGVLLIFPHSPRALHALGIVCLYQSNPLVPCYNLLIHSNIYVYVIVITWAQGICLIYMPKPEGAGIYIRQIPSAHVISDIYRFQHSIKSAQT